MQRRDVLRKAGTGIAAVTLANSTALAAVPQASDKSPPTVERFTILDRGCTSGDYSDPVIDCHSKQVVTIKGTIFGSNSCATAVLESVTYDPDEESLDVVIATRNKSGSTYCLQCIYAIDYAAVISLNGVSPKTVSVIHRGVDGTREVETEKCSE